MGCASSTRIDPTSGARISSNKRGTHKAWTEPRSPKRISVRAERSGSPREIGTDLAISARCAVVHARAQLLLCGCSFSRCAGPWRTLSGHSRRVNSITFSEDGLSLISTGDDGTLRVWRLAGAVTPSNHGAKYMLGSKMNTVTILPSPPEHFKADVTPLPSGALRVITCSDSGLVEGTNSGS